MMHTAPQANPAAIDQRIQSVLADHLDPRWGSPYWLARAAAAGVCSPDDVQGLDDLKRLFAMTSSDLRSRPLADFIPKRYRDQPRRLVLGQTGGTTGPGAWTAYLEEEFHAAFVEPFVRAAAHVGFPEAATWLFVGPSGPHIIGQAARAIARSTGSVEPFSVDFDPRWSRKMPAGSIGAQRYLQHVLEQAMDVIECQDIDVLFASPPVLLGLAERMTHKQRQTVRGVHYGGMAVDDATLCKLQQEAYPKAVHLSGYGNTLLGCCLELRTDVPRPLDYFPCGDRLLLEVVDESGQPAEFGRVRATRLDHAVMIVALPERDYAEAVSPPPDAPNGFTLPGVRNPHTPKSPSSTNVATLY